MTQSLLAIGRQLHRDAYHFVTPTPATHARVLNRAGQASEILRDVFGWNREFDLEALPDSYRHFTANPQLFSPTPAGGLRATVRFSVIENLLLAHSGFPTSDQDAVFFGPDTYRFGRAITALRARDPGFRPGRVVDIGAGTGAGGLIAARVFPTLRDIVLADINPRALAFARANAALNGIEAETCQSDILAGVEGVPDLILSNPPYLVDPKKRAYRHGGGDWGDALALRILEEGLAKLSPAGHLVLYTGSPIVNGEDMFLRAARPILESQAVRYQYEELDPDVFGEELDFPPYDQADRIASVVLYVSATQVHG